MGGPKTPAYLAGADPELRKILTPLFARIAALEAQIEQVGTVTQPLASHLDANNQRVTHLAEATEGSDAPTFDQVKKYLDASFKSRGL